MSHLAHIVSSAFKVREVPPLGTCDECNKARSRATSAADVHPVAQPVGTMALRGPCLSPYGRACTGGQQVTWQQERRERSAVQSCLLHNRQGVAQPRLAAGETA